MGVIAQVFKPIPWHLRAERILKSAIDPKGIKSDRLNWGCYLCLDTFDPGKRSFNNETLYWDSDVALWQVLSGWEFR